MDTPIISLFERYKQGSIDRRDFLKKMAVYTGTTAAALTLVPLLEENYLHASVFQESTQGLLTENITYKGESGNVKAFLTRPKENKKYPAVLIIHENRGLQPHIKDVTIRMAKEGFLAMAPDALSPLGGTPEGDSQKAVSMIGQLNSEQTAKNFVAAVKFLQTNPNANGKVGCTGFCWGGGMTNQVAVLCPTLNAAVPYYGMQPKAEDVPKIKAPIMAHYAGNDQRINQGIEAFKEALEKAHIEHQIFMYEGAGHAFNNDSNPGRYNEKAAKLAWSRTIAFFKEKLKS